MIKVEYRLVKWLKNEKYRKLSIIIQEDSVFDFCEMMGWSESEFADNTIRYPVVSEQEDEIEEKEELAPINSKKGKKQIDDAKNYLAQKVKEQKAKKEVIYSNDKRLKPISQNKSKQQKYPDEMVLFVENHMNENTNQELCDLINHNYHVEITKIRLAAYMAYKKLKRDKKKVGKPKIWTDEVIKFLRDNRDKYSNEELIKELKKRFNIEATNSSLNNNLSQNKIIKDLTAGFDKDILDFVLKSKITDVHLLRDEIIEKFSKNMSTIELKKMISKRTEKSQIESVPNEVKRISKSDFDEDVDEMDLDR